MDKRININYHSTDELLDMLRQEVEMQHTRGEIVRALEELTGQEYDDDRLDWEDDDDPDGDEDEE